MNKKTNNNMNEKIKPKDLSDNKKNSILSNDTISYLNEIIKKRPKGASITERLYKKNCRQWDLNPHALASSRF